MDFIIIPQRNQDKKDHGEASSSCHCSPIKAALHPYEAFQALRKSSKEKPLNMLRHKTFLTVLVLILLLESSSCQPGRAENGKKPAHPVTKVYSRKALLETTLDYDYGQPNHKHDPKNGKPGTGGKPPIPFRVL